MIETLEYLTQIKPARNYLNISSLNKVADFLKNKLNCLGLETSFQNFIVENREYKNVVASLNTHFTKRLVIGAHYDICGDFQGADDNASAVAGLIETAKELFKIKEKLNFRVDFVCFTLEEPPYFGTENMGSFVYAKYLYENKIDILGLINYEMIGYYTQNNVDISKLESFISKKQADTTKGNYIAMVSNNESKAFLENFDFYNINKEIEYVEAVIPSPINQITASDHLNFWQFGFNAIMVTDTAFFRNPNYHTKFDTLDTLNTEKMKEVVDLIVKGVMNFA
jgi:Zn-dependent M28 family amino/carboxypeptidase